MWSISASLRLHVPDDSITLSALYGAVPKFIGKVDFDIFVSDTILVSVWLSAQGFVRQIVRYAISFATTANVNKSHALATIFMACLLSIVYMQQCGSKGTCSKAPSNISSLADAFDAVGSSNLLISM